jgi:hypothetical protein
VCSTARKMGNKLATGRHIADLEQALRDRVPAGTELLCDNCIGKLQPVPRTDRDWARRRPQRTPRCASNGWECEKQVEGESKARHTETLLLIGDLSLYRRRKMGIADYASEQCLCRKCFDALYPPVLCAESASAPPETPPKRSRSASDMSGSPAQTPKQQRTVEAQTPAQTPNAHAAMELLVDMLLNLPDTFRSKLAGVCGALSEDHGRNTRMFGRMLNVSESSIKSGTAKRACEAIENGAPVEDITLNVITAAGNRERVPNAKDVTLVTEFFKLNSVPANDGRPVKRFPGEQHRFLEDPIIRVLLPAFRELYPALHMSVGRFSQWRRKYVPFIRERNVAAHCSCKLCANMWFRMEALGRNRRRLGPAGGCDCLACSNGFIAPLYDGNLMQSFLC